MTTVPENVQQAYGPLPDGWRLEKLKFFADVRNSNVDKTVADDEEPVRLCNYTDVYYNDRITSDLEFMNGSATEAEIEKFQLKCGQVIITKDSEGWDDIGIPALVTEDMPDVLCGYHLSVLEPRNELDGGFLAWLCRSEPLNDQFKLGANGVTRYGLGQYPMKNAFVALPPRETQQRIARFLDDKTARIDGLIEKKRALLDRLAEKRQTLITRAVTKGLNPDAPMKPSGIDWLGDIPAHWETKKLRYTVKNLNNFRVPIAAELRKGAERTYPYYGASGIIDYVDEYIFDFPTVLVAEDGANLLSRSTPLAFSADGKYWVNNHAHILKPEALTIWFCESILAMYPLDPYISGSAQPKLTKDSLSSLPVWVPPLEEQRQIEKDTASQAAALKEAEIPLRGSLAKLEEYRTAIITAAVTGRLNIPENNVVRLPAKREANDAFKRSVLAAHIADAFCDQPTFGRVKFQKTLHLCEAHLGLEEVGGNYHRRAAGPFDTRMMHSVHSQLEKQGWVEIERRSKGKGYEYRRGQKLDAYRTYYDRYFGSRSDTIDALLALLAPMDTRQSEIVSTAYAAWNDLLLDGHDATDDEILHLILNDWADEKQRIPEERWRAALGWMREKGLIPRGEGSHTKRG